MQCENKNLAGVGNDHLVHVIGDVDADLPLGSRSSRFPVASEWLELPRKPEHVFYGCSATPENELPTKDILEDLDQLEECQ